MQALGVTAPAGNSISPGDVGQLVADFLKQHDFRGKRVLCVVPDGTRTAPLGRLFRTFHAQASGLTKQIDLMIALGTHPPMTESQILRRMEWSEQERSTTFRDVRAFNHTWDQPDTLRRLGVIPAAEIAGLSGGLFSMDVPVDINARIFDYDILLVMGPVFPHEVVGFSGGNKYFFPGIGGAEILNFFHWLGAVVTNPMIIGNKWTPVRRVVDRAAALIPQERLCLAMVVDDKYDHGLFGGDTVAAWDAASDLSAQVHITYEPRAYRQVLSCAPPMYDELWVAGKCMYKLEPVLADGAELIIYAPHLHEISTVHGKLITEIGYHCRDYFLKQWDRFQHYPWGVLAHSTHVHGLGTYEDGVETPRVRVVLATGIPEDTCRRINLGYRDPATIRMEDFQGREEQGILCVPKAGERLYHQKHKPGWAGG